VSTEKIRELQEQAMMTQRDVADEMGVALSTYQAILYGKVVSPHYSTIKKLAKALGVDPRDIMERESRPLAHRSASPSKTQVEMLEHALSRFQELGERDPVRWGNLQGCAWFMLERTKHRDLRDRYEEVYRRAWDGWLEANGIDRHDPDAAQAIEELVSDSLAAVEDREKTEA
jgi:transcriptional regulator with XRE-family HTH domain